MEAKVVDVLYSKFKGKKISTEIIINALDNLDCPDDFEITDELIARIAVLYKQFKQPVKVVDAEKESLRLANKKFNENVKGIIETTVDDDDDWVPISNSDNKTKQDWEAIQNKLDLINNKFEEMTS
jgi:hypothetical protein